MGPLSSRNLILTVLSVSLLFCLSLWFSANAISRQLIDLWNLNNTDIAILSLILILGFVTGGIASSIFNLPDIIKTKNYFVLNAMLGALTNFFAALAPNFLIFIVFRFFTGYFLAGVYPTAMKLTVSWFKENRGLAVGILLGALTAGSGLPYLFNLIGIPNWRVLLSLSSILALIGGVMVYFLIIEGPHVSTGAKFQLSNVKQILKRKSVLLANFGYFGHMFELYAFWVWIPVFLQVVYSGINPSGDPTVYFSIGTFLVFATGAIANAIGGQISDKIGRTAFNIIMLLVSGLSSLVIGFFMNSLFLALLIAIMWGITIIPDSPQYSAMISELSDQKYIGTALTIQTAVGFGITIISIRLMPIVVDLVKWNYAFMILVIGPIFGILALLRLRKDPDSIKIAQGKK